MSIDTYNDLVYFFNQHKNKKDLNKSLKWIKQKFKIKREEAEEKILEMIQRNPFTIPTISLSFAKLLYQRVNLNINMFELRRFMGELLRRCFYKIKGKTYSDEGMTTEDYERDIGLVIPLDFNTEYLEEYGLRKVKSLTGPENNNLEDVLCLDMVDDIEGFVKYFLTEKTKVLFSDVDKDIIIDNIKYLNKIPAEDVVGAIYNSLVNPVSITTGEAGTGKSTVIENICMMCEFHNIEFRVVSFTGKAIANIKERIVKDGLDFEMDNFTTIHSLYYKYKTNPPDGNYVLILEEASMISTPLIAKLFGCINKLEHKVQLVIVGDNNQLPPIDWGCFFDNVLTSEVFPVNVLTKNYRASEKSGSFIIPNSRYFKQDSKKNNFKFDNEYCVHLKNGGFEKVIEMYSDINSYDKTMLICPWNKRKDSLNKQIQERLRKKDDYVLFDLKFKNNKWHVNDKVIFLRNSNKNCIYNGTEGHIIGFDVKEYKLDNKHRYIYLDCKGKKMTYYGRSKDIECKTLKIKLLKSNVIIDVPFLCKEDNDLEDDDDDKELKKLDSHLTVSDLDLAYCITCHKSQGAQAHTIFLDCNYGSYAHNIIPGGKNNIYTAITRSMNFFYYIGDPSLMKRQLKSQNICHDTLRYKLKQIN